MAFIRHKTVGGKQYAQVVENYRDSEAGGKHRQRVLLHLGRYSPAEALVYWDLFASHSTAYPLNNYNRKLEKLRELLDSGKLKIGVDEVRRVEERHRKGRQELERIERELRA